MRGLGKSACLSMGCLEQACAHQDRVQYLRTDLIEGYKREAKLGSVEQAETRHHVLERNGIGVNEDRLVELEKLYVDGTRPLDVALLHRRVERGHAGRCKVAHRIHQAAASEDEHG